MRVEGESHASSHGLSVRSEVISGFVFIPGSYAPKVLVMTIQSDSSLATTTRSFVSRVDVCVELCGDGDAGDGGGFLVVAQAHCAARD